MVVGQLEIQMLADLARLRRDMEEVKTVVGGAVSKVRSEADSLKNLFSNVFRIGGIAGVIAALRELGGELIQAQIRVDKLRIGLQAVVSTPVSQEIAYLTNLARKLGLEFNTTALGYVKFAAASRDTALEGEGVRKTFEAVSKASAVLGLSADETAGVFKALTQMISKGTVQSEELRGQLAERLAGGFQIASRAMGVTTQQLSKMLEQGEVISADFLPKFAAQLEKEFGAAAESAGNRAEGAVNRLASAWDKLKRSVAEGGIGTFMANRANALSNDLTAISQAMDRSARSGGGFFAQMGEGLGMLIGRALGLQNVNRDFLTLEGAIADATATIKKFDEQEQRFGSLSVYSMSLRAEAARDLARAQRELDAAMNKDAPGNRFRAGDNETLRKLALQERLAAEAKAKNDQELGEILGRLNGVSGDYAKTLAKLVELRKNGAIPNDQTYIRILTQLAEQNYKVSDASKKAADEERRRAEEVAKLIEKMKESAEVMQFEVDTGVELTSVQKEIFTVMQNLRDGTLKLTGSEKARLVQQMEARLAAEAQIKAIKDQAKANEEADKAAQKLAEQEQQKTAELEKSVAVLKSHTREIGMSDLALAKQEADLYRDAAAFLELRAAVQGGNDELEKQAKLLRERANLTEQSAAVKEARKAKEEWEKTAEAIHNALEDALMRAFESGHKFFSTLWEEIKNAFKTTVFKLAVNTFLGSVGGAIGGPIGQAIGGGSSVLGAAGSAASVMNFAQSVLGFNKAVNSLAGFLGAGATAGAATGSLAIGNAVGAVGGDALGAFIAANNTWAGVATGAAEAATGAATAAEAAATATTAATAGSSITAALAAIPGWGWAAMAAVAVAAIFGGSKSTPHAGGYALASSTGQVTDITAQQGGIQNKPMQDLVNTFAVSASQLITNTAKTFGEEWKGAVRAVFESDNTDPSWGLFHVLDEFGQKIAGLDALGTLNKDPAKGFEEFVNQSADAMRSALIAIDLPHWADDILGQIKEGSGLQALQDAIAAIVEVQQKINIFQDSLKPLGGWFTKIGALSSDAVYSLGTLAGGIDNLTSSISGYIKGFFSESKQTEMQYASLAAALAKVGLAVPDTKDAFVRLVEAQDLSTESGRQAFVTLMSVSEAFLALKDSAQKAADTLNEAMLRNLRKFQTPEQQKVTDFGVVAQNLSKVGVNIDVGTLMNASKDQILAFATSFISVESNSLEAKVAVLDAAGALYDLLTAAVEAKPAIKGMSEELSNAVRDALPKFLTAAQQTRQAYADIADSLSGAGVEVGIDQLMGLTKDQIYAFASAFITLGDVSDDTKVAVVNAASALADLKDEAIRTAQELQDAIQANIGKFQTPEQQRVQPYVNIAEDLSRVGVNFSIGQLMGASKEDIYAFASAFVQLTDVSDEAKTAVVNAAGALADLVDAADNKVKQVFQGLDSVIGDFLSGDELATYMASRIQQQLKDAGIDSSIEGIMNATKDDVMALFNAVGVDGKLAVLEAIPAWKNLQEVIHGTTNAINAYRQGTLANAIEEARLNTMKPQERISTLRGQESQLFAEIQTSNDPVAVAQRLQDITLRRIKEEGDLRAAGHQKEKDALTEQISALEKMKDLSRELSQFTSELMFGELSPFNARIQTASAKDLFSTTVTGARSGDQFAMGNLTSAAKSYLSEAASAYGLNSSQYLNVFNEVQAALKELGTKKYDPQLQTMKDQLTELESLDDTSQEILAALLSIDAALGTRAGEPAAGTKTIPTPPEQGVATTSTTSGGMGGTAIGTASGGTAMDITTASGGYTADYIPALMSLQDTVSAGFSSIQDYSDFFTSLDDGVWSAVASSDYQNEILMSAGPLFVSMGDKLDQIVSKMEQVADRLVDLEGVKTNTNAIASIDQAGAQGTMARLDRILESMEASRADAKLESRRPVTTA